jgi:arylsulfatase A-like enzyme
MNLDFFPTLLALAGVGLPEDRIIDGKNILPILTGRETRPPHEAIYFYHYDILEGVRSGKWKYFRKLNRYVWPVPLDTAALPDSLGKKQLGSRWPLLYDLELDPNESYNVINTYPDIGRRLLEMMTDWERVVNKNPRGFHV